MTDAAVADIAALVRRCAEGDEEALAEFFEKHAEDMYNFPLKVFHLDEDAGSDFFLYAYERLRDGARFRSFQGRSSFRTWFYAVLRNLVIDWMRTVKEVETVQPRQEHGSDARSVENVADPRGEISEAEAGFLADRLSTLPMELRLVLKLCFIYYLDLEPDELEALTAKSGRKASDILELLVSLRHGLSDRELSNIEAEDKITSLFLSIQELKSKRAVQKAKGAFPFEVERLDRAIEKKYKQREALLTRKARGHFTVRTPYKTIGELLGIPEGSVSVQMMRAMERIRPRPGEEKKGGGL